MFILGPDAVPIVRIRIANQTRAHRPLVAEHWAKTQHDAILSSEYSIFFPQSRQTLYVWLSSVDGLD
jgi:hypothetical protein